VMGNHVHLIALVEDPTTLESFMERFKCETAHAINRLLGRRQVTVWCEGYDSPMILTLDALLEKVAYVYANPVRAHRASSINSYQGVSSWTMRNLGQERVVVQRIRRNFIEAVAQGELSPSQQQREADFLERQAKESLVFTLSPDAWMTAFPGQTTIEQFNDRLLKRITEIEQEMSIERQKVGITLPSVAQVRAQPINVPYSPQKFTRRMWCICGDVPIRVSFIKFIKKLRAEGREVSIAWARGDFSKPFPVGLFPPSHPMLASMAPAFLKKVLSTT
jgi:hypothetical protein